MRATRYRSGVLGGMYSITNSVRLDSENASGSTLPLTMYLRGAASPRTIVSGVVDRAVAWYGLAPVAVLGERARFVPSSETARRPSTARKRRVAIVAPLRASEVRRIVPP